MSTPINPNRTTVLTSWKEIARYLGKGVRTVQRWEEDFGLPIRRPHSANKKAVLARPRDLDAWVAMRCSTRTTLSLKADGDDRAEEHQVSSAVRSRLSANMETARLLHGNHQAIMTEVSAVLDELSKQLAVLQRETMFTMQRS
jgi:hypothetical protein